MGAVAGKKLEAITCPICKCFSSKRLTAVENHLINEHNSSFQKQWDIINNGPVKCACGCGNVTTWIGWKHGYSKMIVGHNGNIYAVYDEDKAKEISQKRKDKLIGQEGWAKGLTKETDERIAERGKATSIGRKKAFDEGKIKAWSKGLTKETDERVAILSKTLKEKFKSGELVSWQKNKTEYTLERIKQKSIDLRKQYAIGRLIPWHKGKTKADDPRLNKAWKSRDPIKEYAHVRWTNEEIEKQLELNICLSLERIENYRNDRRPAIWVRCRMCGWVNKIALIFARTDRCPNCQPKGSIAQHEIANWIESFGFNVGRNVTGIIGRMELDVYIPVQNFAIEFNGLYYHNESAGKDEYYHQVKSDKCNKLGIKLFHIFEDEWRDKKQIIKSMIAHAIGKTTAKIYARNCIVKELTKNQRSEFFTNNHIDGDVAATYAIGLFDNNKLVAALSLRKPFHKKYKDCLEVARVCTLLDTVVIGGLSKMTSHVKQWAIDNKIQKLLSYVDTRFGSGKGWSSAGWILISETSPRFWWTDFENRFNRFKFKADKKLGLTELQIADQANVVKIWGCKNLLFETVI